MKTTIRLLAVMAATLATAASAQFSAEMNADYAAIRQTALDYIEGWYTGDAERMERALHPDLAKRLVYFDSQAGGSGLNHQSALTLVQNTRFQAARPTPEAQRQQDVAILDKFENAASVRIVASDWVDYLHIVRWNGEWKIINVLWELKPQ